MVAMEFVNETGYQADALWGPAGETTFGAAVIAKATYDVVNGELRQTQEGENPWPVHFDNLETPYGLFISEYCPYSKPCIDLIICGSARPRQGRPVREMDVTISLGRFRYAIRVFGDRVWEKRMLKLVPSEPEPFVEMPLTLNRAYGGAVSTEWGEIPFLENPHGKGFLEDPSHAEGGPLPNLENPNDLIRMPTDRPDPVAPCVYPGEGGLRAPEMSPGIPPDQHEIKRLSLCWAHPHLMLERSELGGEMLMVNGISPRGLLSAPIPELEASGCVTADDEQTFFPLNLDTIIVLGDENRVVFRWYGTAKFEVRPRESRKIVLSPRTGGE